MKIRNGFVSNSSSSSFILQKEYVTPAQIKLIKAHILKARKLNEGLAEYNRFYVKPEDEWELHETEATLEGYHYIDNFDMEKFMQMIGVDMNYVEFSDKWPSWSTRWDG